MHFQRIELVVVGGSYDRYSYAIEGRTFRQWEVSKRGICSLMR